MEAVKKQRRRNSNKNKISEKRKENDGKRNETNVKKKKMSEKKIIHQYLKTRDPTIFGNFHNVALKLILLNKADELAKISRKELVARVEKMKEILMHSVIEKDEMYVCKLCGVKAERKADVYSHILSQHSYIL